MTTPFNESEVIRRTARRLGRTDDAVREFLDVFTAEYIKHARETEPDLIRQVPAKTARKRTTAKAKVESPADGENPAEGSTEGAAATVEPTTSSPEFSSAE